MPKHSSISSSEPTEFAPVTRHRITARRGALVSPARSRRVIAWGAATFVIGTLIASILIDYCPRSIRFPEMGWALHRVDRTNGAPMVIFFGSSRFAWGIRTEQIAGRLAKDKIHPDPPYQFISGTIPAGDPVVGEVFVHELAAQPNRHPRLLLIEISPETVSPISPFMDQQLNRLFTWRDIATSLPDIIRSQQIDRLLNSRLVPVYHHSPHFRQWIAQTVTTFVTGSQPTPSYRDPQLPPSEPGIPDARRARRWLHDYHTGGRSLASLEHLLAECKQNSIPTLLIGVPVSSPHRACYTPDVERQYRALMSRLESTYGTRFIDFASRMSDDHFVDTHHLTYPGSLVFTEMLTREVLIPTLTTPAAN